MKLPRRRFLQLTAGTAALHALTQIAEADDYPSRPIRLIVGFTPGTATDIAARTLANGAEGLLGQKMVVENKPGAGSALAAAYVARAANDGYTLFVATLSLVTIQAMKPDAAFDLGRDFAPVSLLAKQAVVLVVNPQSNLLSVSELITLAKSKPGEVLCGNAGIGGLPHFAAVLLPIGPESI
jgi:tripartite-type tricarboxylate transporter receptor subunit TctC